MGRYVSIRLLALRDTAPPGRSVSIRFGDPPPPLPPILIAPDTLAEVVYGAAYLQALSAIGGTGPYTWGLTGAPSGIVLGASSGLLTGSSRAPGSYPITVTVTDSTPGGEGGPATGAREYTLVVEPLPPVWRGLSASIRAPWSRRHAAARPIHLQWQAADTMQQVLGLPWRAAAPMSRQAGIPFGTPAAHAVSIVLPWAQRASMQRGIAVRWSAPPPRAATVDLAWGVSRAHNAVATAAWRSPPPVQISAGLRWSVSAWHSAGHSIPWSSPPDRQRSLELPWRRGRAAPWRITEPTITPPPPPPPPPTNGRHVSIRFACLRRVEPPQHTSIPFGPWQCYVGRRTPRIIIVTNTVSIIRVGDNAPIAASSVTVRGDLDSALWTCQMSIADAASLALLQPGPSGEPRRVRVTINGHAWVFLIESYTEAAQFGNIARTAGGRSITAVLTRDYAPVRTRVQTADRDAQQLADEELDGTGYTVDWQGPTWLVPGGLWSYADLAPLDALRSIAEACGCVLQSHPTNPVVQIVPAFRARPWAWGSTAPDVDIVDDYVVERRIGSAMGVRHNAVEVRGESTGGIRGEVTITGSAGDIPLPQVSHPLITAYAAAEARGIYELSRVGPIGRVTVELHLPPPETSPGLVLPGTLPRLSGSLMTRAIGVSITATWQDTGGLYVRQSLELERHYDA